VPISWLTRGTEARYRTSHVTSSMTLLDDNGNDQPTTTFSLRGSPVVGKGSFVVGRQHVKLAALGLPEELIGVGVSASD